MLSHDVRRSPPWRPRRSRAAGARPLRRALARQVARAQGLRQRAQGGRRREAELPVLHDLLVLRLALHVVLPLDLGSMLRPQLELGAVLDVLLKAELRRRSLL